jgi:diguanylate cyclase (GGDEF)-like protein
LAQAFVNRCWICLLACTLMGWWPAQGRATPVRLTDNFTHADVGRQLQVLEDPFGKLGLDDVRAPKAGQTWADHHSDNLNFGYSHSAFWLRGELINQATQQTDWLVGMRYPLLDYLDIYVVWPDGRVQHHASGDRRAFGSRDLDDRHFYFRLKLQAGDKVQLYARVQGQGSLQAPLEISTPQAQMQRAHREQLLLGIYSGALLAMLVYNLLLSISLRDGAHLYYVVYMAMFGMAQFALSGLAFQHLWPNKPNWGNEATPVFMGLAGWSLLLFSRNFLQLKRHAHRTDKVMQVLQWLFLAAVPATFVMPYAWPIKVVTTATFVVPAVWLLITARLLQQGVQQARYFLAAFGGLLLGSMLTSLHMFGLVPGNVLTEYGLQIGSLLEFTLLSFALAHRLKLAQDDNAQLQRAHAAELESRVQARTHDLDQAMGELTEANQRLHELSELDALTGLKNRMFLSERLPEMWRQAQRWHTPIAVLMIDADHFKKVNDEHGHLAGDEGLRQIASVIKRVVQRPGDHAVRFGGEEFLVVLPQTHTVGAAHIAESIRLGVQSMGFQFEGKPVPLTVSIGVASVVPSAELQPQALLNAADQLLYKAKQSGRNRCALLPDALATLPRKQVTPAAQPNPVSSE